MFFDWFKWFNDRSRILIWWHVDLSFRIKISKFPDLFGLFYCGSCWMYVVHYRSGPSHVRSGFLMCRAVYFTLFWPYLFWANLTPICLIIHFLLCLEYVLSLSWENKLDRKVKKTKWFQNVPSSTEYLMNFSIVNFQPVYAFYNYFVVQSV